MPLHCNSTFVVNFMTIYMWVCYWIFFYISYDSAIPLLDIQQICKHIYAKCLYECVHGTIIYKMTRAFLMLKTPSSSPICHYFFGPNIRSSLPCKGRKPHYKNFLIVYSLLKIIPQSKITICQGLRSYLYSIKFSY